MKCIKNTKNGNVIRVEDSTARQMVGSSWVYVSKEEWKSQARAKTEKQVEESEKKEQTVSEKALRRNKLKDKQRPMEMSDRHLV